ncbi:hypothetical protein [Cellulomonas telluris]|uniref:hypothetical protein n=1 Tax=Cellulomonas telluris TaxID=2306636 RepID=UPI0010A8A517|nr:hypothetical protein [Cellulomonas telluris]
MSTRLDLALTEIADAAGRATALVEPADPTATLTVHRIAARVRRRRAVRAGAAGAVAASAAGAAALVGPGLASGPVVAARPDAAPGTCGSSVARLPAPDARLAELHVASVSQFEQTPSGSEHLGSWGGTSAVLLAWRGADQDVPAHELVLPDAETAPLTAVLEQDGVVVAVSPASADLVDTDPWYEPEPGTTVERFLPEGVDQDEAVVTHRLTVGLTRCDDPGARLPAGDYGLLLLDRAGSGSTVRAATAAGTLAVARPAGAPPTGLPAGFPGSVPLAGGELVSVRQPDPGRWVVQLDRPEEDALGEAEALLREVAGDPGHDPGEDGAWFRHERDGWRVQVLRGQAPSGRPTLTYLVRTDDPGPR